MIGNFPDFVLNFAPNFLNGVTTRLKSLLDRLWSPIILTFDFVKVVASCLWPRAR